MRFSRCALAVAAARDLFTAPVQPEIAPAAVYPAAAVREAGSFAAAPLTQADFVVYGAQASSAPEESSAALLVPALVVAGVALAGYSLGRTSFLSEETPVEEYDPSALELAGPCPADVAMLGVQGAESRREFFAKAGAALASVAVVESASAKAGQFTKLSIFDIAGEPAISSPYAAGGPVAGQITSGLESQSATYGFAKSDGPILADGYAKDITREKAALEVSKTIVRAQQKNIDTKTWWLVRDNLRGQAYKDFWKEIDQLDLACKTKELALAQKEYQDVLAALKKYEETVSSA